MKRYAWATDTHFDHVTDNVVLAFAENVRAANVDGLILSGDISVSNKFVLHLSMLETALQMPILFVLGNHDMWGSSTEHVRKSANELVSMSPYIRWIASSPYVQLSQSSAVVGHDGWYDALYGDPNGSSFAMNDWSYISDFVGQSKSSIIAISRKLAHEATTFTMTAIKAAARYANNIYVVTHVPPVPGPAATNPNMQWFSSKMMGDMLRQASVAYPNVRFTVLSGHTHERQVVQLEKNVICLVGAAKYGAPSIERIIEVP